MRKKSKKRVVWIVLGVVLAILAAAVLVIRAFFTREQIRPAEPSDDAVVETENGMLRGSIEDGVYQYLGVPYARAEERFVPAEATESWEGVRDASETGPISPQSGMLGRSAGNQSGTDNNCQNLNIWTPGTEDGEKRAVMVWLHGGGFSTGSANDAEYNGADLSKSGDVVVVSVNHRLGVSGFLDLSAYGEKYKYSGNVGLTDIVSALQWIHDNIEAFGGDSENVTLFGQSGGGAKVLAMMTTPYAKGLFQRGIVQSGATETMGITFTSREASTALTERILKRLEITEEDIEEIQNVPIEELEEASSEALQETAEEYQIPAPLSDGYAMEWGPVIDGDYMPTNPVTEDSFADNGKGIDLLIGSNLNEWTMMMGGDQGELTEEETAAFEAAYPEKDAARADKVDTLIRLPMLKIMSHKADQGDGNVYAYVFTWDESRMGAYHGAEIPFVFAHDQNSAEAQQLMEKVSQAWVNFAKTGVPSTDGLPQWETYDRESGATMLLDAQPELVYGHDRELMHLLAPDYEY